MNLSLALLLILISSIFGAFSTLFFKMGSGIKINLHNKKIILAVLLAGCSLLFYVSALKYGTLTFIYIISSASYLWNLILAKLVLKEVINKYKLMGITLILLGVGIAHI